MVGTFFHQSIPKKAMLILRKEALTGCFSARTVRQHWDFSGLNWRLTREAGPPLAKPLPSCRLFVSSAAGLEFHE